MEIRNNINNKNIRQAHRAKNVNTNNQQNQPTPSGQRKATFIPAPAPTPLGISYAATVTNNIGNNNHNTRQPQPAVNDVSAPNTAVNENLWSIAEVTDIIMGCIDELSNCRSKFEQAKVITNLLKKCLS